MTQGQHLKITTCVNVENKIKMYVIKLTSGTIVRSGVVQSDHRIVK